MFKKTFFVVILLAILVFACKEKIIEYRFTDNSIWNDAFHGDIVGRVLQKGSEARVYLSQISVVDSTIINPMDGSFVFRNVRVGNYDLTIYAENYRIYRRQNVIVTGGGIAYLGDIDLSKIPDLIARHYPENNDEVVYDNRFARLSISILFTQPMDRASVERAFSTDPPTKGVFYWGRYIYSPIYALFDARSSYLPVKEGAVITTYSKITSLTYIVSQRDSYVDTTYTVTLSTEARDTAGNHLRFPLVFKFRTVQAGYTIYGIHTIPEDGSINVRPLNYSGITVVFPRRMEPVSTEAALNVSPSDSRIVLWPEGNRMVIYMGGIFRTDTLYQVTIDSTAQDLDGNKLGERFSFSFRTEPLTITNTYPSNGALFVSSTAKIGFNFNTNVLKSTVQQSFSISPAVSGTFRYGGSYEEIKNIVEFIPSAPLQKNVKYTVTVSTSVKDMFGTNMKKPLTISFVTSPE